MRLGGVQTAFAAIGLCVVGYVGWKFWRVTRKLLPYRVFAVEHTITTTLSDGSSIRLGTRTLLKLTEDVSQRGQSKVFIKELDLIVEKVCSSYWTPVEAVRKRRFFSNEIELEIRRRLAAAPFLVRDFSLIEMRFSKEVELQLEAAQ